MAFLRKIRIRGHEYVYLVESYRNSDRQPRQRVLRYLGPVRPIYDRHVAVDFSAELQNYQARKKKHRAMRE